MPGVSSWGQQRTSAEQPRQATDHCLSFTQVLSNPKLRRRYDACGRAGVSDAALLDPGTFYASLFGSELFEHLLGELAVTTLARAGGGCSSSPTSAGADSAAMKRAQARREGQLADNLNALLRRHVEGDAAGFKVL